MSVKFTPGQWMWDICDVGNETSVIMAEIYTIKPEEIVIAEFNYHIPEGKANARLIAAAPEMFELLERAYRTSCDGVFDDDWLALKKRILEVKGE